jgi:hypothetical protein
VYSLFLPCPCFGEQCSWVVCVCVCVVCVCQRGGESEMGVWKFECKREGRREERERERERDPGGKRETERDTQGREERDICTCTYV